MTARLSSSTTRVARVLCPAVLAATALFGCEGAAPDADDEDVDVLAAVVPGEGDVAEVTAVGSGCPTGSWSAVPSADGKSVTLKLDAFDAKASAKQSKVMRDCTLAIKLRGGEQLSYAPTTVEAVGVANGTVHYTHTLSWEGRPEDKRDYSTDEGGVINFTSLHSNLWSPCGGPQTLLVRTAIEADTSRSTPNEQAFSLEQAEVTFAVRRCDAPPVPAQPSAPSVKVRSVQPFGVGCRSSSSRVRANADGQSVRVDFDALTSSFAPPETLASSDCRVMFEVDAPPGYDYAIESFAVDARANLERGAGGRVDAHANVFGRGPRTRRNGAVIAARKNLDGPLNGDVEFVGTFSRDELDYAPCGSQRPVSLNLGVGANGSSAASVSITALRDVKFALKRCASR